MGNKIYWVLVDGAPVLACHTFGAANHAAFDDLPGFDPLSAGAIPSITGECETEVLGDGGVQLACYLIRRGRLARPLSSEEQTQRHHMPSEHAESHSRMD